MTVAVKMAEIKGQLSKSWLLFMCALSPPLPPPPPPKKEEKIEGKIKNLAHQARNLNAQSVLFVFDDGFCAVA